MAHQVHRPDTLQGIQSIVRAHMAIATPLAIYGGNTRPIGADNVRASQALSLSNYSGITTYNPAEMVMSAKAGTPVSEIEAALSSNNQMLPFEPMDHRAILGTNGEPTIGGIFAANVSGPRRFAAGAARDCLLGVEFINGKGELIKAGGRVMKNVTGLDLVKLLAGSFGTLGVMSEVTFRVLPRPQEVQTLVIVGLEEDRAALAMASAMATPHEISGAAHLPMSVAYRALDGRFSSAPATLLRLEGLKASVDMRMAKLRDVLSPFGAQVVLDKEDSQAIWAEVRDVKAYSHSLDKPLWRVSTAPSLGHQLVAALRLQAGIDAFYDWQGGLIWMQMEAANDGELIRQYIKQTGGHATLVRAGRFGPGKNAFFQPLGAGEQLLSQRIKAQVDPQSLFNPLRMGF
jgi:glycolate oxidase FAD binding subunit